MEYYSAIKRSETVPFAETCRDIETVIQNTVKSEKELESKHTKVKPIVSNLKIILKSTLL